MGINTKDRNLLCFKDNGMYYTTNKKKMKYYAKTSIHINYNSHNYSLIGGTLNYVAYVMS